MKERKPLNDGQLDIEPRSVAAASFTGISFSRVSGYSYGTSEIPVSATTISVSLTDARPGSSVILFHNAESKPTFENVIIGEELGTYITSQVNRILVSYLGNSEVIISYLNQSVSINDGLEEAGTIVFNSPTSIDVNGFIWRKNGDRNESGLVEDITVTGTPTTYTRIDILEGGDNNDVYYITGVEAEDQPFPQITAGRILLQTVIRLVDGTNTVDPEEPDFSDFVSKSATGNQTIQSNLTIAAQSGKQNHFYTPDINGRVVATRGDFAGRYYTSEGIGYAKMLDIFLDSNFRYTITLEHTGISTIDFNGQDSFEKGLIFIGFDVDGSNDISLDNLKLFGQFNNALFTLVKTASDVYSLYVDQTSSGSLHSFRPIFSFGGEARYQYYNMEPLVPSLPAGDQYSFSNIAGMVDSVTGDGVDNTDPKNPVLTFPTPEEINANVDLGETINDALLAANSPSSTNPFVTAEQLNNAIGGGNIVLFGGVPQWSGVGLIFDAPATGFIIDGVYYEDGPEQITLTAADPTDPRRDRFVLSASGWGFLTGSPAEIPVAEEINPITQIDRGDVLIDAGATTPTVTSESIYTENTEWAASSSGAGTFNPNSTADPFQGTKSFEATSIQNSSRMIFTRVSDLDISAFDSIGLQIKLKASMNSGRSVFLQFVDNSDIPVSTRVAIPIIKSDTVDYQFSSVALSDFTFNSMTTVRKLWITYSGTGGPSTYAGYFVDNVILQGGITEPDAPQNVILTNEVEGSGTTGAPINVVITEKFISNRTEQTDPLPGDAQTTFRLADGTLRKVAASLLFSAGADGNDGWSPVFGIASDGARRVLQLTDWVGGEGAKPATGQYVGASGLVVAIGDGIDIRGEAGVNGTNGTNGADGADGADGREVELQVSGTLLQWRYVGDPSWTTLIDLATLPASSEFALGGLFRFDTTTTDADPGAGKLRFNNATVASATFIYIDTTTDGGVDISNYTKSLRSGDVVYIQNKDSASNWVRFKLTANAVDGTGYYKLEVEYVDGSGTIPSNNQKLLVIYNLDSGSGGGGGHVIKSNGTPLTQRAGLNFSSQFTVTDDEGNDETDVTIDETVMATREYVNGGATTANAASRLYLFNNY